MKMVLLDQMHNVTYEVMQEVRGAQSALHNLKSWVRDGEPTPTPEQVVKLIEQVEAYLAKVI